MKRLLRRLSRVADSSDYHPIRSEQPLVLLDAAANAGKRWRLRPKQRRGQQRRVPEGHVPVCVGEEMVRFSVRTEVLGRPAFVELLRRSAEEYGYDQVGVLHIPCSVPLFRRLLLVEFSGTAADQRLEELFRSHPSEIRPCVSPAHFS